MINYFVAVFLQISDQKIANIIIVYNFVIINLVKRGRRSLVFIFYIIFRLLKKYFDVFRKIKKMYNRVQYENFDVNNSKL